MPVLIWEQTDSGPRSRVETDWPTVFTTEEVRDEAEELDRALDGLLDGALERVESHGRDAAVPIEFTRAWSIGSAIGESAILDAHALKNEQRSTLWLALARKCRTGIRSRGELEPRWRELRPSTSREPRREGRKLDYFEMCLWLAEQPFVEAAQTFGGSVRNAWQMLERPTLRPLKVRRALLVWLLRLDDKLRSELLEPRIFANLMKALRSRWPDRGPGSARRPVHLADDQLLQELAKTLDDLPRSHDARSS